MKENYNKIMKINKTIMKKKRKKKIIWKKSL